MNRIVLILITLIVMITSCAQQKTDYVVTIKTDYGNMVAILYDETPKHKQNFIKLAKERFYDSLLFHRVIQDFMIQGGDPNSKKATPGQNLGNGGPGYTVDAEILPQLYHEKGALSAARLGDQVNPTKASSGSQFYIVQGKRYTEDELIQQEQSIQYQRKNMVLREVLFMPEYATVKDMVMQKQTAGDGAWLSSFFENADTLIAQAKKSYTPFRFSDQQKQAYTIAGGTPHLDGEYTVFGKVISGLDVIDKIAAVEKNPGDRPASDVRMIITVEEMPKSKIEKQYGYKYPSSK
ncbi:peptidylprolyl isomerase [Oscillatoria amoena NRMC-F 0135]|nr:peptidylprolyl isomerase [Oscillatoria amoena NRMC-F 0135]